MLKKIVLGTLFISLIGVLVAGAVVRTMDKTALVAEAQGYGRGRARLAVAPSVALTCFASGTFASPLKATSVARAMRLRHTPRPVHCPDDSSGHQDADQADKQRTQ